ncbi:MULTISPECIES: glycosyltransferase family 4 protein [Flavobacteriaceae]|uniref:Glycosyltransferase family 4 protein n=2 Tax=Flavobacteriaceae TaxID=49546 RepID=A0A4Y8AV41_9FLAO|nr:MULTISPECIES: glycosyltransferase family 4 protein [Flavobacteriaceae]TEW75240.1 glycosyltransferase family 4 protein [Gramella jeungdoensis]GGK60447.1 glycosyl transferase [Lutibacter litoralis]
MKILYITNGINGSGGLERVLAVKASYLADILGYEVAILTLNNGHNQPFYKFSTKIKLHDIKVVGNLFNYILSYRKGIKKVLKNIKPNVISVCDDGFKGLLFPVLFGKSIPVIYERHVSKQIENKKDDISIVQSLKTTLKFGLMNFGATQFHKFVVLTNGNLKEWKELNNIDVIPNPLPFNSLEQSAHTNKKVLVVGKQSYQKGYDRLLAVWSLVSKKYPDWKLEVYGKLNPELGLEARTKELGIDTNVKFYPPVEDIQEKYKEASIYIMTSRFEGFGMVLIEAMSFGVPCVAFDCPHGPSDIIQNGEDGFLIANGDIDTFAFKLMDLMENKSLRQQLGTNAIDHVHRFNVTEVVKKWDTLFKSLVHLK